MIRSHIMICGGTGCTSSGSKKIQDEFKKCINAYGLNDEVQIVQTGCFGLCALGPVVLLKGLFMPIPARFSLKIRNMLH